MLIFNIKASVLLFFFNILKPLLPEGATWQPRVLCVEYGESFLMGVGVPDMLIVMVGRLSVVSKAGSPES